MSEQPLPSHHGVEDPQAGGARAENETIRLLLERSSCRNYLDREIPPEVMQQLLDAGIHAATGGNLQPYSILSIRAAAVREKLAEMCEQPFMAQAPVHLIFCLDVHRLARWAGLEKAPFTADRALSHFWIAFQDTIISAQSICTAADALGLGSVYIGTVLDFFGELREMFGLPQGVCPVVLLCLGYPAAPAKPRRKLGAAIMVHEERYRDPSDEELRGALEEKYRGARVEPTRERLEILAEVCRAVSGEGLARAALERVRELGYIHPAQRTFGLHYRADRMPADNEKLLGLIRELGFDCFQKYEAKSAGTQSS